VVKWVRNWVDNSFGPELIDSFGRLVGHGNVRGKGIQKERRVRFDHIDQACQGHHQQRTNNQARRGDWLRGIAAADGGE
jgi:hypothetical protein